MGKVGLVLLGIVLLCFLKFYIAQYWAQTV
jgi:hypothetical protein